MIRGVRIWLDQISTSCGTQPSQVSRIKEEIEHSEP